MEITKKWLKEHHACEEVIKVCEQDETDVVKLVKLLIQKQKLDGANWLLSRFLGEKGRIKYAIYAARQVLPIYANRVGPIYKSAGINDDTLRKTLGDAEKYLQSNEYIFSANLVAKVAYILAKVAITINSSLAVEKAIEALAHAFAAANINYITDACKASSYAADATYTIAYKHEETKILIYGLELLKTEVKQYD